MGHRLPAHVMLHEWSGPVDIDDKSARLARSRAILGLDVAAGLAGVAVSGHLNSGEDRRGIADLGAHLGFRGADGGPPPVAVMRFESRRFPPAIPVRDA